jgi:hypothetical protein
MAGLVTSRRIGNTRLVRANTDSPYDRGLADVLTKPFRVPRVLANALRSVEGVERAYIFGSWAARFAMSRKRGRSVISIFWHSVCPITMRSTRRFTPLENSSVARAGHHTWLELAQHRLGVVP